MLIFVDENIPYLPEALKPCGKVITFIGRELQKKDLQKSFCEYLFVRSTTKINMDLLEDTDVKFVGTATSGIDHIDTEYLKQKNIHFVSAPGSNANSVAELVFYSILKWANIKKSNISNKIIGIIGFGNIGKIVAEYANYFKMKILVNDPPLDDNNFAFPDYLEYTALDDIFSKADIITNHVPLYKETKYPTYKLIREHQIEKIKRDSLFIHASRGYVVDENALINRLKQKDIFAAIDVWENEPNINFELANATILSTPHIGGYSRDGKLRGAKMMADAYSMISGLKPDLQKINEELELYQLMGIDKFKDPNYIFNLLKKKRLFEDDNLNLLASSKLSFNERGQAFDSLRKNYPIRRESL